MSKKLINWRDISKVGTPKDPNITYLVTDGTDIATSDIYGITRYGPGVSKFTFKGWSGDEFSGEHNECCSGERYFDLEPTHWCPVKELNLPNKD